MPAIGLPAMVVNGPAIRIRPSGNNSMSRITVVLFVPGLKLLSRLSAGFRRARSRIEVPLYLSKVPLMSTFPSG